MKYTAEQILNHMDAIGKGAYSHFNTLQNSYNMAIHCINNNIEGDFVECGVAAGSQIAAMGLAMKVKDTSRTIWAFDSFEGIPLGNPKFDSSQPGIGYFTGKEPKVKNTRDLLVTSGISAHSVDNVQKNFAQWNIPTENVKFIKGWFQDTMPVHASEVEKIAILRLDGDLYESTLVCLEALFQKLVSGGILIIDDWALEGCKLACDKFFKKLGGYDKVLGPLNEVTETTPVWFVKK